MLLLPYDDVGTSVPRRSCGEDFEPIHSAKIYRIPKGTPKKRSFYGGIVNGGIAVENGRFTGLKNGRVLRKGK